MQQRSVCLQTGVHSSMGQLHAAPRPTSYAERGPSCLSSFLSHAVVCTHAMDQVYLVVESWLSGHVSAAGSCWAACVSKCVALLQDRSPVQFVFTDTLIELSGHVASGKLEHRGVHCAQLLFGKDQVIPKLRSSEERQHKCFWPSKAICATMKGCMRSAFALMVVDIMLHQTYLLAWPLCAAGVWDRLLNQTGKSVQKLLTTCFTTLRMRLLSKATTVICIACCCRPAVSDTARPHNVCLLKMAAQVERDLSVLVDVLKHHQGVTGVDGSLLHAAHEARLDGPKTQTEVATRTVIDNSCVSLGLTPFSRAVGEFWEKVRSKGFVATRRGQTRVSQEDQV